MNKEDLKSVPTSVYIATAAVVLQLIMGIVAAVWVVSQISGATSQLQGSIGTLTTSVERLSTTVGNLQSKQYDHEARIRVIESDKR